MEQALKILQVPIKSLNPAPYNPRTWSQKAIDDLKESIKRFGFVDAILVNKASGRENVVIGGHFRLSVAKKLGYKEVPVVYLDIPDKAKERELNLRLNRNTGDWDLELLKQFDTNILLDVGFDDSDLESIWNDVLETEDDDFDLEKEATALKEPFVQPGDLYQLGPHKLLCGDATNPEDVERLMDGQKVPMIYMDPPFNIGLSYNHGIGTKSKYGGTAVKDNKSTPKYREFLRKSLQNALDASTEDTHCFCWSDERYIGLIQSLYEELGVTNQRVCLWLKNNAMATPQYAFNKVYEPCIYGVRGNPYLSEQHTKFNEVFNKEIGTGNRLQDDILDLFNIWLVKRLPFNEYQHPTQKPPTLHEKALRRCTKIGDIVLDLFGGSGSTLIACEQLKRTCYMMEICPTFSSLIITRYEQLTGHKAKKLN